MIFCFSGNGNSRLVADRLAEALGENVVRMDYCTPLAYSEISGWRVIWVFPIYSWGLPPVVRAFIRRVAIAGAESSDLKHFMVCTCGDDIGLAHRQWRKEIRRRGWSAVSAHSVIMPNTYVLLPGFDVDTPAVAEAKLAASAARIAEIAHAIKCDSPIDNVVKGKAAWLKTKVVYPLFMAAMMSPRPFNATDRCVGCGKCVSVCPMKNITMNDDTPHWGERCAMCLGCYHACPHHAVAYGKRTLKKGQYVLAKTLPDDGGGCNR